MVENPVKYEPWDIIRAFLTVGKSPRKLSRAALCELLELGEGSMRSVLDTLKQRKLISATQRGHALTAAGETLFRKIGRCLSVPQQVQFSEYPGLVSVATVLRGKGDAPVGAHERDIAVREGAEGAVLLAHTGKLTVPGFRYGKSFSEIETQLEAMEGDLVIIAFAQQQRIAENAALRIAAEVQPAIFPGVLR